MRWTIRVSSGISKKRTAVWRGTIASLASFDRSKKDPAQAATTGKNRAKPSMLRVRASAWISSLR